MSTPFRTHETLRAEEAISAYGTARSTVEGTPLSRDELRRIDAYWRASLYLCLGMLYLKANPLLREPLILEHIKPRLLGHWGSDAGQAFTYIHFNRLIKKYDLNAIYISGPGHGAPAILSQAYLEGTYSEIYPEKSEDTAGLQRFFKQFSFPGGIGSHATPETPGSIHEGGELGYSISHAYGTVYDHPDLITLVMVGDGESETGPLSTSWHSNKFLNPITDGAVLPVLHLNGYKINNPTILARISHDELKALFVGYGYTPYFVEGSEPESMHQAMAATLEHCVLEIRKAQQEARQTGKAYRPRWPMVILRSPKGWTAPREVDGHYLEGFWRAHQIPITDVATNPGHLKLLESWLRGYRPEELFDDNGRLLPELKALAPTGNRRMSANPVANGGLLRRPLDMPDFRDCAVKVAKPGATLAGNVPTLGNFLREVMRLNMQNFRVFGPDETQSNKLEALYDVTKKVWLAEYFREDAEGGELAPEGRVMEMLSEHTVEGWLEGYLLTGRHGLINSYEPFIHVIDSMFNQHAKWLEKCNELPWRAKVASLNLLITALVWRQDHNGFTHQDPGFLDVVANKSPSVVRIYLPPDANCLLSVADHCLQSVNYANVIIADKQVHLQYLDIEAAIEHCTKGVGIWAWASNDQGAEADVVMASCGDCPTMESLAATALLRQCLPDVKVRFVNVVDLFKLVPNTEHPHGLTDREFEALFTPDKPVVFNFHAYPWLIHRLTYHRPHQRHIHVRGYKEQGNINTPLELAIRNQADRFSLAIDAIDRMPRFRVTGSTAREALLNQQIACKNHAWEYGIDSPEITIGSGRFKSSCGRDLNNEPGSRAALDLIASNYLSRYEPGIFAPILDALPAHGDHYMHLADLKSYLDADQRLYKLYADGDGWARKAILNVANSGKVFQRSHHRAIRGRDLERATLSGALERTTQMDISPLAGKPAPREMLVDLPRLEREYFERRPDLDDPEQLVSFGTSGHRGSPFLGSFTEAHILAITQAICDYRRARGIDGPLYMEKDTHALSGPAQCTALEVLAANEVQTIIQQACGVTPTPVISHAILVHNRSRTEHLADGIVITPSHNPPEDGGFKYNPTHGGPADTHVTQWIENRANEILRNGNKYVRRVGFEEALRADTTHQRDFVLPYVKDLRNVVDMEVIQAARLKLAVDPLGGAAVHYWEPINTIYKLDIAVVNPTVDPAFSFMTVDHDGKIRMDCSSPYAMASLVGLKDRYRVAFANDPDSDRHGIVTPSAGLMNPNHYLAVAISYLLTHRPRWPAHAAVGKTLVSSSIIDRVVNKLGRRLSEVPVGFKWFVPGLFDGSCCFSGEESAGASFLRHDGGVWTTDKDGPIMDLLAAEITARTGKDPGEHYRALTAEFGTPLYTRIDEPATVEQKSRLEKLSPAAVKDSTLAGEPITAKLSRAPGNDAPIDGLKVIARSGWFAARPSGTEAVYKIYAESFKDEAHLNAIVTEAQAMVNKAVAFSG